MSGRTDQMKG